jgi:hypothetical protein
VGKTDVMDGVLVQWFDCDSCITRSGNGTTRRFGGANDFRTENISFAGSSRVPGVRTMALQLRQNLLS